MPTQFAVPDALEIAYRRTLTTLIKSWLPTKLKDISDEYWLKELTSVSSRKSIIEASTKVAFNMITRVNVVNFKSWREASIKAQRSSVIYTLLQEELKGRLGTRVNELVKRNAGYITDLPREISEQLLLEIADAHRQGTRPDTIANILKLRFPAVVNSKIARLARTQSTSANTGLTRARSEDLGIPCFLWWTAQDGRRVRPSHRNMQGVICFWSDLPSPEMLIGQQDSLGHYAAGDCPNCRCQSLPMLHTEDAFNKSGTARVYRDGRIQTMTIKQFTQLSGIEPRS